MLPKDPKRVSNSNDTSRFAEPMACGAPSMDAVGEVISDSLRETIDGIVACGAIMTFVDNPLERQLVGDLRWVGETRLLWLVAFGDSHADGHILDFDRVEIQPAGFCFCSGSNIKGFLTPIHKSTVEDADDYRIAWQLWQEIAPTKRPLIDRIFSAVDPAAGSRNED